MDILLIINKADVACKLFDTSLFDWTLKRFEKVKDQYNVKVFTSDFTLREKYKNLVEVKTFSEAIQKFSEGKKDFIIITRIALCKINFENLIAYHKNHGKKLTIVCKNLVKNKSIPIYKLDENKTITSVNQKRFADCGIYVCKENIFKESANLQTIIQNLIDEKEAKAFVHRGYWWTAKNLRKREFNKRGQNVSQKGFSNVRRKYRKTSTTQFRKK